MASGRIAGITIEIGGDTTKLVKALSSVDGAIKKTQTNLRDINKALKFDPGNTALLKDKQNELAAAIEQTTQKIKAEQEAFNQMKSSDGFDANSEAARNLQTQIDLDTAALKQLEAQAKQSASVLGTQFQLAGQKMQAVGDKIKSVGDGITNVGRTMTATVTTPIVGGFAASIKAATDWETAFTGVKKTVNATSGEYDQLAANIKKMATETASSKEEIAGVMEIAGQLGVSGVDNLTTFTKTMIELGDTTNLSAEDAATSLARFMNITGESTGDVDKIGSAIVDLGNNFATSESEITEMATRLASAGTIAGMSSTDILALSAAMSSVGIQAEAGGTAMSQTLKTMANAVADFKDGDKDNLETIAEVSNMTAEQFAEAWEGDPITAMQAFIKGLSSVKDSGDNVFATLSEMGMEGIRQTNMLQSLALASDMLASAVNTSSTAYKENSALSNEASMRYETMAAKMSQLKERITEVAISIGESLMPHVQSAITVIEGLVDKWNSLDSTQQAMILKFAMIAAAIGPVLMVVGTLVSSIGSIISTVGSATSALGGLMTSMGGLSGVLAALASPVGIVVAAVAALAAGFAYLYTTSEQFRTSMNGIGQTLITSLGTTLQSVQPQLQALGEAFNNLMTVLAPVFEFIITKVAATANGIISAIGPIVSAITSFVNLITATITGFFALMTGDYQTFFTSTQAAIQAFIGVVTGIITAVVEFWKGFFQVFGIDLQAIFTTMWENIKLAISTAIENIKTGIETTWNSIKEWLSTTLESIKQKFLEAWENIKQGVSEKIQAVKETIVNGINEAVEFIKSLPSQFYSWGADMINNLVDGIKSGIGAVESAVSEIADTIAGYIHFSEPDIGPLSNFHTYMPDMMKQLAEGINAGIPMVAQAMNGLATNMIPQTPAGGQQLSSNTFNINVYGAQGQNVSELADIIERRITENTIRRGVAFG